MVRIILIGGGSSSGKSYITTNVIERVGIENVTRITLDDYYKDQADVPLEERYKVNYDHPSAFDWPLMRRQIKELKEGKTVEKPIYDFVQHTRSDKSETIVPKKIVLVEGIMALVDKRVRELGDIRVFITASAERRFLRRVIRDRTERGRTFENIVNQYFGSVQPMYGEIVEPSSQYADVILANDGVENLAVSVLASLIKEQLILADSLDDEPSAQREEFDEKTLQKAFTK